jgi:L-ascorbate metabolism protein UlaG (beta-lactamase superfamily)
VKLTHLGTATLLIEVGGFRLLTDPVFDPSGTRHAMGWGFASTKEYATPMSEDAVGRIDAVLLSHDQHGDNLDHRGRKVMANAPFVVTTPAAARRLNIGGTVFGLAPFESRVLENDRGKLTITGTPCRHGPPLSLPFVGAVTGFVLEWEGQTRGPVYITGDTVFYGGITEVASRFDVGVAIMHLGCAAWGPLRFTMNAREATTFATSFPRATLVPVHYDGWTHFKQGRADFERAFAQVSDRVTWLDKGVAHEIAC